MAHQSNAPTSAGKTGPQAPALSRRDVIISCILFVVVLLMYGRTAAPGLLYGDSGEFQTLAYLPGMSHVTGAPLYLLMAWVFAHLPFGNPAYQVNLMSAFFGALTVGLVYLDGVLLWRRRSPAPAGAPALVGAAALVGALALAVSYTFWSQAVIAEVYTTGTALMAAILLLVLCWQRGGSVRNLALAGLLGGLSLGVHLSVALMAPAVLVLMIITRADRRAWRLAVGSAILGVLIYLAAFVLVDAQDHPVSYYNATVRPSLSTWELTPADFDSLPERLRFQLEARQFQGLMFTLPPPAVIARAGEYGARLADQFAAPVIALAVVGFLAMWAHHWRANLLLLLTFGAHLVYDLNYNIGDIHVFYIPTYLVIALWASAGAGSIMAAGWRLRHRSRSSLVTAGTAGLLVVLTLAPWAESRLEALGEGLASFVTEDYPMPVYNLHEPHDLAATVVQALPPNAILFVDWDVLYPLYYVAYLEQDRSDLLFYESYPQEGVETLAESAVDRIQAALAAGRPVFLSDRAPELAGRFRLQPRRSITGTLFEVMPLD